MTNFIAELPNIYLSKNNVAVSELHTKTHTLELVIPLFNYYGVINLNLGLHLSTPCLFVYKRNKRPAKVINNLIKQYQILQLLIDNDYDIVDKVIRNNFPRLDLEKRSISEETLSVIPDLSKEQLLINFSNEAMTKKQLKSLEDFDLAEFIESFETFYANKQQSALGQSFYNSAEHIPIIKQKDITIEEKIKKLEESGNTLGSYYKSKDNYSEDAEILVRKISNLTENRIGYYGLTNDDQSKKNIDPFYFPVRVMTKETKKELRKIEDQVTGLDFTGNEVRIYQDDLTVNENKDIEFLKYAQLINPSNEIHLEINKCSISEQWEKLNKGNGLGVVF